MLEHMEKDKVSKPTSKKACIPINGICYHQIHFYSLPHTNSVRLSSNNMELWYR